MGLLSRIGEKWSRLQKGYASHGFEYLMYAIPSYLPNWLMFYTHQLLITGTEIKLITRKYKDYTVRKANLDDVDKLQWLADYNPDKVTHLLRRGDTGALVLLGDKLVSMSWACIGKKYVRYSGWIFDTGDDGIFLYGMYSVPEERIKGLFASCLELHFDHYAKLNRHRKYAGIDALNRASLALHKRIGFEVVGETYYFILFGIKLCYYKKWPRPVRKYHLFVKQPPDNLDWV